MDRLRRVLAGGTLVMLGTLVTGSGCRSTRNEVPPGPKYTTGDPTAPVGFNSSPRPYNAMTSPYANSAAPGQSGIPGSSGATGVPGAMGGPSGPRDEAALPGLGSQSSFGTPTPTSPGMGSPTNNLYGAPGTSGTGN